MEENAQENTQDNGQDQYNKDLIKFLNKILEKAKVGHPTDLIKKINRYYAGLQNKNDDKTTNQRNLTKEIVEAKTSHILDGKIITTVIPKTKSMATVENIRLMEQKAAILDDCVKEVFKENKFDTLRQVLTRDLVKKMCVLETYYDAAKREIILKRHPIINFFPDPLSSKVEDMNFIFFKEQMSPILLKSRFPDKAEKIDKALNVEEKPFGKGEPQRVITGTVGDQTSQSYTYGDPSNIVKNSQTVPVWKLYLKDDSVFEAEASDKKGGDADKEKTKELGAKYPYGRVILFVSGSEDLVLEDKPLDYPFGFPVDICYNIEGDTVWESLGDVETLFENQNRMNNAYAVAQSMIGKAGSWIINDPANGIKKEDFVNKTVLIGENFKEYGTPQVLTNNTLEKFNLMVEWIGALKQDAYDMSRLNEQMVSGTQEENTTSGKQVEALNESPMSGIRTLQRNYAEFLVSVTKKIIVLIQRYYVTAKIIRISNGQKYVRLPTKGSGANIEVYDNKDLTAPIEEIKGDLTMGQYDVDIIAGSETPRSPTENANLKVQLYQMGLLGADIEAKVDLLDSMDVPGRKAIIDRLRDEDEQKKNSPPELLATPEGAKAFADVFKALTGFTEAKQQLLKKFELSQKQDTLDIAPVQEVSRQSDIKDVVSIAPQLISENTQGQIMGKQSADQQVQSFPGNNPGNITQKGANPL